MAWRDHYLELLAEGEARKLQGAALGHHIAQRMTSQELLAALRDYHAARPATNQPEGTNEW